MVSDVAFAGNTIEGFIGATFPAGSQDPEIVIIAITLTVFKVAIDTAVLVTAASSVDDSETRITDTTLSPLIVVGVEGTNVDYSAFSVDYGGSVIANTLAVLVS